MQPIVCPRCNGKGKSVHIREHDRIGTPWFAWLECAACHGTGYQVNSFAALHASIAPLYEQIVTFASCFSFDPSPKKTSAKQASLVMRL